MRILFLVLFSLLTIACADQSKPSYPKCSATYMEGFDKYGHLHFRFESEWVRCEGRYGQPRPACRFYGRDH